MACGMKKGVPWEWESQQIVEGLLASGRMCHFGGWVVSLLQGREWLDPLKVTGVPPREKPMWRGGNLALLQGR